MSPRPSPDEPNLRGKATDLAELMRSVYADWLRTRTFGLAAEVAFWLFFALLPLAAVFGMVLAKIAWQGGIAPALERLPPDLRHLVSDQLGQVAAWNGGAVGPVAIVTFVWLGSSGITAIFQALEVEAGIARSWIKRRLLAIAMCVALSFGTALLAFVGAGLSWLDLFVRQRLPRVIAEVDGVSGAARTAGGLAIIAVLIASLYAVGIPRSERTRVRIWPGTALAVVLHAMLGSAYAHYIAHVGSLGAYHAGLVVVAGTLVALYLAAFAILIGAKLDLRLAGRRADASRPEARQSDTDVAK